MATTVTTDFLHSFDGKVAKVQQIAGAWQTLATKADFDDFTTNNTTKQNLVAGTFYYVLDEDQLYKSKVTGFGPFATWSLDSASFSGIDTSSFLTAADTSSFVLSSQTGSFLTSADTSSFVLVSQTSSFITADDTSSFTLVSDFNDITSSLSTFVVYSASNATSASYIDPTFISASAAAAGFGAGGSNIDTSSFITNDQTSSFVRISQTSSMFVSSSIIADTASYIDPIFISASAAASGFGAGGSSIDTSSFVTNDQTGSFILVSQTSSMFVSSSIIADTASYIDPTFISASAAASGFGAGGSNIDTSSFITSEQTSSFVRISQTSSFLLVSETGSFLTSADTSSFILVSQTSSMFVSSSIIADTASYIDPTFISASAAAAGFGAGGSNIDTSSFITNDQTSSFIRVSQTSSMSVATASYVDPTFISASAAASGFGAGGAGGIFTQNGSYYTTTNDLQITGSVTIGDGLLKFKEYSSLPSVEPGSIAYYNGTFWLGQDS